MGRREVPVSSAIDDARVRRLNDEPVREGRYVLYWMQQSQRALENHALEYAIQRANRLDVPVLVAFGIMDDYPEASLRHYRFMAEGLADTAAQLARRTVPVVVRHGAPSDVALGLAREAALVVCDRGYLRHQRAWREAVAGAAGREVVEVESDVIVPVEVASDKAEYAARTLRPKLHRRVDDFLVQLRATTLATKWSGPLPEGLDASTASALLDALDLDTRVPPVPAHFTGGTTEARRRLAAFVREELGDYADGRREPHAAHVSKLSPYLHFGQVSPLTVARAVRESSGSPDGREAFVEELLVRRELASNFVRYTDGYDRYEVLPGWARATLEQHAGDARDHVYDEDQLERGETHDRYWNAAMREMRLTGYLHNHLRMYWGKKILEWSPDPRTAHRVALALNNRWFLDGRDCSSYANIGWLFGLHDRPWGEREIFGTVRYMSAGGLERKTDIAAYLAYAEGLT